MANNILSHKYGGVVQEKIKKKESEKRLEETRYNDDDEGDERNRQERNVPIIERDS